VDDLKVKDIMQAEVIAVGPDTTVRELADILAENKISGVPVIDEQGTVLGMVSEADIIVQDADLHFPYYIQFLDSVIYVQSFHKFEERFKKAFGTKVGEIMSTEVVAISPDASVRQAATLMADRGVNRLPVTEMGDPSGRLLGIVTRGDIVRAIAERD
jgi:CBS domain-containing protein